MSTHCEVAEVGVEVAGDRGERGVHDGAVEERDAGAEHRGGDDPPSLRGAHVEIRRSHASSEARAWQNQSMSSTPARTLSEKVWDRHVVHHVEGEPDLLYIDLHLVHEVTSPQAFDGLRLAGRTVRRPDLTVATMDHNVPTEDIDQPVADPISRKQMEVLAAQLRRVRHPPLRDGRRRARASCTSSAPSRGSRSRA